MSVRLSPEQRLLQAAQAAGMWPKNLVFMVREWLTGGSSRDIAFRVGASRNTVQKLARIARAAGIERKCGCGRAASHLGMCGWRLERNSVYGATRKRDKPAYLTAIEKATTNIAWIELRNEVRQEMCLHHLAGTLPEDQFAAAAKKICAKLQGEKYHTVSLDSHLPHTNLTLAEILPDPKAITEYEFSKRTKTKAELTAMGKRLAGNRWNKKGAP